MVQCEPRLSAKPEAGDGFLVQPEGKKKKSSFKFMVSETMQLLFHFPPMPLHPPRRPVSRETIQYFEE